jgi:preprotein translocase subunit SecE
LKRLLLSIVTFTVFFMAFLVYNDLQTGHPLLQPFSQHNPSDRPFTLRNWSLHDFLYDKVYTPLKELNLWIPLSLPLLVAFFLSRESRRDTRAVLLLAALLSLFVAYLVYMPSAADCYGPRYLYEASFAVFILIGCVIVRWQRIAVLTLLVILCLNVSAFVMTTAVYTAQVRARMNIYDLVKQHHISNAIVFLRTASSTMDQYDLARNGIHFDQSVLYVHDRGDSNAKLLRAFPGRSAYIYEYDPATKTGRLTAHGR